MRTPSDRQTSPKVPGHVRGGPWFLLILALVMGAILAALILPAAAYVSTTITINGNMSDWTPVLASAGNAIADGQGADDPDNPGTNSRDLDTVASTWDATNVYLYFRRTTTGNNSVSYIAYLDRDGDGRMESTDMVARFDFNGASYAGSALSWYRPVNATTGDTYGGNGVDVPGSEGNAVAGAAIAAAGAANGIEVEGRISWASLQLPKDSGIIIHYSIGQKAGLPGAVEDNVANQSLRRTSVSVTPDRNYGTAASSDVTYWHTIQNTGNATDTFTLTLTSSQNWAPDLFGPDGTTPTSTVTLGPGKSMALRVQVNVPPGTEKGTEDITVLQAQSKADATAMDQSTDITFVGPVTVTPPRTGSMAPSGTIDYIHTVRNNTGAFAPIVLTAVSAHGWTTHIYRVGSTEETSVLALANGASADIVVRMSIPPTATYGMKDALTVRGRLQSDPTSDGIAIDDTTVSKAMSITPNNSGISGPNATAQYTHTITNSWMQSRTVDVQAVSSLAAQGWSVSVFDEDGITPFAPVELGPFGGSRKIIVRVAVPGTATSGTVDTTSVRLRFNGSTVDTATDTTTVGKLATYATAGYVDASSEFHPLDTVYARGMGLSGVSAVRFRWMSDATTTVYTSPPISVDVNGMASTSYSLPSTSTIGTWKLILLNSASGAVISGRDFLVTTNSWITLTIDTNSSTPGVIQFGSLDPGQTSPVHTVAVTVNASGAYNVSHSTGAGATNIGLSVVGTSDGNHLAGLRTYSDNFVATPTWDALPGLSNVDVQYTAYLLP